MIVSNLTVNPVDGKSTILSSQTRGSSLKRRSFLIIDEGEVIFPWTIEDISTISIMYDILIR